MAAAWAISHYIIFTTSVLLLLTSVVTLGLAGHAKWSLERHLPGLAWYVWKGGEGVYDEQLARQQWVTWENNEVTERLSVMRAVLGIIAGAVGAWGLWSGEMGVKDAGFRSRSAFAFALAFSVLSVVGTLTSAILSYVLQHHIVKACQPPKILTTYSTRLTCTREVAACAVISAITPENPDLRERSCTELITVRWLTAPMMVFGTVLVAWCAIQVHAARRRAVADTSAEERVAMLEKAD